MRSAAAMEMKSSSSPPPSLPDFLQRAVKALAPPILGACLAVGMPLIAPAELSPEQKLVRPLPPLISWTGGLPPSLIRSSSFFSSVSPNSLEVQQCSEGVLICGVAQTAQAWTTVDASYVDRTFNNQVHLRPRRTRCLPNACSWPTFVRGS